MQKINFLRYQSLKILQPDWPRAFLHITREPDFSQTCGFNRIIKVIMVHDLNPKNLHINGSMDYFFAKSKNPCFLGVLGYYPQNEIFSKKSGFVSFLPLRHPNFMGSFRKILRAVLKKTRLPTDILTY